MAAKEPDTLTPEQIERAKREFLQRQKYAEEHKEQLATLQKKWVESHKEEKRVLGKKYDDAHREERRLASRAYYQAHREELLQKQRVRREREKNLPGEPKK